MIKHMCVSTIQFGDAEGETYLCSRVPFANQYKLVYRWSEVTCKKCLKKKPKGCF